MTSREAIEYLESDEYFYDKASHRGYTVTARDIFELFPDAGCQESTPGQCFCHVFPKVPLETLGEWTETDERNFLKTGYIRSIGVWGNKLHSEYWENNDGNTLV